MHGLRPQNSTVQIRKSILQCGILSLLLFNFYIDNLANYRQGNMTSKFYLYADDLAVLVDDVGVAQFASRFKVLICSPINKKIVLKQFVTEKLNKIKDKGKFIDEEFSPNIQALCITPQKNTFQYQQEKVNTL